jgi:hypothetical protein
VIEPTCSSPVAHSSVDSRNGRHTLERQTGHTASDVTRKAPTSPPLRHSKSWQGQGLQLVRKSGQRHLAFSCPHSTNPAREVRSARRKRRDWRRSQPDLGVLYFPFRQTTPNTLLAEPEWQNRLTEVDLRALSPLRWRHVNPYGTFTLNMQERLPLAPAAQLRRGTLPKFGAFCVPRGRCRPRQRQRRHPPVGSPPSRPRPLRDDCPARNGSAGSQRRQSRATASRRADGPVRMAEELALLKG